MPILIKIVAWLLGKLFGYELAKRHAAKVQEALDKGAEDKAKLDAANQKLASEEAREQIDEAAKALPSHPPGITPIADDPPDSAGGELRRDGWTYKDTK